MVDRAQQSKENARCGDLSPTMTVIARIGAMAAHIPYSSRFRNIRTYEQVCRFRAANLEAKDICPIVSIFFPLESPR